MVERVFVSCKLGCMSEQGSHVVEVVSILATTVGVSRQRVFTCPPVNAP